jgi:hypothetical protein
MPSAAPAAAEAIVVHLEASEPSGSAFCKSVDGSSESLCGISSLAMHRQQFRVEAEIG